ncbi:MAG: hypothetical protein ABW046_23370 [Actinoplanes sp.]
MTTTEINPNDLAAAVREFPAGRPVYMVNLLRFRPQARYSGAVRTPDAPSGREVYMTRYLPAFNRAMAPHGVSTLVFAAMVAARVAGPSDANWDAVAVATYPSIEVFRDLVEDPVYVAEAAPHRLAALADWQLFATAALEN